MFSAFFYLKTLKLQTQSLQNDIFIICFPLFFILYLVFGVFTENKGFIIYKVRVPY